MTTIPNGSQRTAVYRFFGEDDVLLYVGITDRIATRFREHAKDKPWWSQVKRQTAHWYGTRAEAEVAEQNAIHDEDPLHNRAGKPGWHRLPRLASEYLPPCPVLTRPERTVEQIRELAMRREVSHAEFRLMVGCLVSTGSFRLPAGRKLEQLAKACGVSGRIAFRVRAEARWGGTKRSA